MLLFKQRGIPKESLVSVYTSLFNQDSMQISAAIKKANSPHSILYTGVINNKTVFDHLLFSYYDVTDGDEVLVIIGTYSSSISMSFSPPVPIAGQGSMFAPNKFNCPVVFFDKNRELDSIFKPTDISSAEQIFTARIIIPGNYSKNGELLKQLSSIEADLETSIYRTHNNKYVIDKTRYVIMHPDPKGGRVHVHPAIPFEQYWYSELIGIICSKEPDYDIKKDVSFKKQEIKFPYYFEICPSCEGEGNVAVNGHAIMICQDCDGSGNVINHSTEDYIIRTRRNSETVTPKHQSHRMHLYDIAKLSTNSMSFIPIDSKARGNYVYTLAMDFKSISGKIFKKGEAFYINNIYGKGEKMSIAMEKINLKGTVNESSRSPRFLFQKTNEYIYASVQQIHKFDRSKIEFVCKEKEYA